MTLLAERLPSLAAGGPIDARGYELTKTGIVFHRSLNDVEHETLGRRVAVVANATPWQLGDWLVASTGRYVEAGSAYERLHELTGRSFDTIRTYLRVALAYSHDERGLVSWTFYRDALRLPATDRMPHLRIAAQNRWTLTEFGAFIATRLDSSQSSSTDVAAAATRLTTARRVGRPYGAQHVQCPHCRHIFPVKGHPVKEKSA